MSTAEARAVWLLAVGQTLGYACFFYIFAAMVVAWQAALGWDKSVLAMGPTIAILVAAGLAPFVGRAVDRGHATLMMTAGPVLGGLALAVLALAETRGVYLLAWMGLGVAQALCLYEVCFALLIRRYGADARKAITRVTLVAGFASTLTFPSAAGLTAAFGWRAAVWVAVAVALGVVAPLHLIGARRLSRGVAEGGAGAIRRGTRAVLRLPGFWRLAAVFSALSLGHWMLISLMLPVFHEQGLAPGLAVAAAACIGPAQVLGRVVLLRAETRIGTGLATRLTLGAVIAAALLLAVAGVAPLFAFAFAGLQGAAMGIMTILRPMLVAGTMGSASYGGIAGMMSIPTLIASAAAPLLGALLMGTGGAALLIGVAFVLALVGFALALPVTRRR